MTDVSSRPHANARTSTFERLAGWSYRRHWWAVLVWVLVLVGLTASSQLLGSDYRNDFSLPGTESQEAVDTLSDAANVQAGGSLQIVLLADGGVDTPAVRERVEPMLAEVGGLPHVADVASPYDQPSAISPDGTIGYATVALDVLAEHMPGADTSRVIDTAQAIGGDGLRVELGGDPIRAAEEEAGEGPPAELAGVLAALVILVLMFGSLLAASLPVVIAIFAVGSTIGLIVLASHTATVADFTPPLMLLVGLGVGIDYALLVFARYRSELLAGADRERASRTALDTAGRTVFFAGCTVIIALLGLVVLGLGSLQGVAVAVALTVLMTMLAALTLLPSLLAIFGRRIERRVRRRAERAGRRGAVDGARWRSWAAFVQRWPVPAALVAVVALLAIAAPALGIRLGFADAGNGSTSSTSRQAYDLLADGFGAGINGPLIVVVKGDQPAAEAAYRSIDGSTGVADAVPPAPPNDGLTTLVVFPDSKPQDVETTELVERLRTETLPPVATETGARFLVGGSTAATVDFSDAVADRLPLFLIVVVALSALLLLVVFRSLLIPLKAALFNLLSVGASLGVITLVFQHGAFGVQPGPVEAFVPIMIFAIVFGLSMDYEVFLLARMHEEWERSADAGAAVRAGLATTGRVVTAAAAIMVVVFGAFMLSQDRMLQQFGLGLASAILLDAVVIRCVLVPAVMQLLGTRAWWLPAWLGRRLPRVALERT